MISGLLTGRRRSAAAGAVLCAVSAAVPAVWGEGVTPSTVQLLDGIGWLSNATTGDVVRVNGETGRVDARVGLGGAAADMRVEQAGDTVLVNTGSGEVRRLDVSQLDWGVSAEASGQVMVGDRVAYVFDLAGTVKALDPDTLQPLGEDLSLDAAPVSAAVAGSRLVVALDDGTVAVVHRDEVVDEIDAGSPGDTLHVTTLLRDQVAILNVDRGEVRRLDPETGEAKRKVDVELPDGEIVVPRELKAGRLWVMAPRSGELVALNTRSGSDERLAVADAGHTLVGPVALDGHVYLVDGTARSIVEVDAKPLKIVKRTDLPSVTDASKLELIAEGGKVFVNDPNSATAVVIDGDDYRPVDKYANQGVAEAPSDTPPPPGVGQGAPTDDAGPTPGSPVPAPGAPAPLQPPPSPVRVEAVAGNERATVSWAHGSGGGFPSSYNVSWRGGRTMEVPGTQLSVEVDNLRNGETYTFEVWASNDAGDSDRVRSNPVEPNDEVPGAPGGVRAESGDASARVSWSAADGRGNDIARYIVTAEPGGRQQEVPGNSTNVDFTGLTNGTTYTFTVTAVNDRGNQSAPSDPSNQVMLYGPPGKVRVTVGSPADGRAQLTWTDAPNDSETPVTYRISVTPAPGSGATDTTQETSYTVTGMRNGVEHTVTITPTNDRGEGEPTVAKVTPGRPPTVDVTGAERTGDRQFRINYTIDNGGRSVSGCTVSVSGGGGSASCGRSSGSATVSVPQFATQYTFTVTVTTELGSDPDSANGTSNGKPLTVDASATRWDGATCSWPDNPYHRPLLSAAHTCQGFIGWAPDNATVRASCWTTGEQYQDDQMIQSNRFVRATYGGTTGYMGVLYFDGFQNQDNQVSGLPRC